MLDLARKSWTEDGFILVVSPAWLMGHSGMPSVRRELIVLCPGTSRGTNAWTADGDKARDVRSGESNSGERQEY